MTRLSLLLLTSALLSTSCVRNVEVIPDPTIPHKVAEEGNVVIWAQDPQSKEYVKTKVRLLKGWWIASPQVVEPNK